MSTQTHSEGDTIPPYRQRLLRTLASFDGPVTVDRLADYFAASEPSIEPHADWATVHQQLHEVDFPALDSGGMIHFDRKRGLVDLTREGQIVSSPLSVAVESDGDAPRPKVWRRRYTLTTALAVVLFASVAVGQTSSVAAGTLTVTLFGLVGAVQMISS
ncbi:hypothetical protein VB773_13160 [Haloarculaceae archaeon H-GB2-1]|nr:hypothetical protein [Haloarculaceae archaeon H-GB1-1]MEA5408419.1 hypothetical protein [Haloarculaceae archaeon H-GB2-1]